MLRIFSTLAASKISRKISRTIFLPPYSPGSWDILSTQAITVSISWLKAQLKWVLRENWIIPVKKCNQSNSIFNLHITWVSPSNVNQNRRCRSRIGGAAPTGAESKFFMYVWSHHLLIFFTYIFFKTYIYFVYLFAGAYMLLNSNRALSGFFITKLARNDIIEISL